MKNYFILLLLISSSITFAQKKEKVKGSKIVTIEKKQIESFNALEVFDNLEVFLVKGTENAIEIEADDNLHQAIEIVVNGSTLRLSTLKDIISYKKLSLRVTYTDTFKSIITKNESQITALSDLELETISFRCLDFSKVYLNAKTKNFELQCDDKAKVELNLKSEKTSITVLKNANVKALIASNELIFDMYQKSTATIEGDVDNLKLRLDNNANFDGKNLTANTTEVTSESYTNAAINVKNKVIINASGKSEIQLYGDQKIEITRFTENAVLMKKTLR